MRWINRMLLKSIFLSILSGCAFNSTENFLRASSINGNNMYDLDVYQKLSDSSNIEIAQSRLVMNNIRPEKWRRIVPSNVPSLRIGATTLNTNFVLQARWKLKDGREFLIDSVIIGNHINEYIKTKSLQSQWEREGRSYKFGDGFISLGHDIKDDSLRIKWIVAINTTPFDKRLGPDGRALLTKYEYEEYIISIIKGQPISGVNFNE